MNLTVNEKTYRLEFRHISKLGKRAQLHKGSVKAVTTCVVIADSFIAIDNSLCADEDNFSRREGRLRSLNKLLDHCAPLREIRTDFVTEYLKLDPDPAPRPAPTRLTEEQVAVLKDLGVTRRRWRQEAKSPATGSGV